MTGLHDSSFWCRLWAWGSWFERFGAEKRKKKEYHQACLRRRMHFTPFAISVDGMLGYEANITLKKLAKMRAEKTGSPYSCIINWIRTQISFDLVRSNYNCLY